jgi:PAS domain S-box-containing protein
MNKAAASEGKIETFLRDRAEPSLWPAEMCKRLIESSPWPMFVLDCETCRVMEVNDAAIRKYGFSRQVFLERGVEEVIPAEYQDDLRQMLALGLNGPVREYTAEHRLSDGTRIPVDITSFPLSWNGRPARFSMVHDSRSDTGTGSRGPAKRHPEPATVPRPASAHGLEQPSRGEAMLSVPGTAAHDFNNLLTVIQGNLELARIKLDPASPLVTNIERSLWAVQRGGTLTSQLLAFARKQPLAPAAIDMSAHLPDLVPLLKRTLGEHIDVRFVDSAGLWPAMADPAQLESAVLNLALNARDAMSAGGRLTIELANKVLDAQYARAHAEVTPGDYVMVAVSDTGHGMTPEVAARVFEPFFTTKTEGRGTGLGLAMVFGFVKQSGGHVKIYSEPGEGTSVKIYLPRAVGVASAAAQRSGVPADLPHGSATILVVEDEAGVREIAVAILRSLGYRVLEAPDGNEGLLVFGAHAADIDMLLTDVVLPGKVRGRELAERITAIRPDVRVLFMSGYTENSIVHHGRLDDGVHLLGKPFKREQLARKVAEVLGVSETAEATDEADNVVDLRARKRE